MVPRVEAIHRAESTLEEPPRWRLTWKASSLQEEAIKIKETLAYLQDRVRSIWYRARITQQAQGRKQKKDKFHLMVTRKPWITQLSTLISAGCLKPTALEKEWWMKPLTSINWMKQLLLIVTTYIDMWSSEVQSCREQSRLAIVLAPASYHSRIHSHRQHIKIWTVLLALSSGEDIFLSSTTQWLWWD